MPEVRICARDGCEQTFELNPRGYGSKRLYCDDHKTVKWGAKKKDPEPLTFEWQADTVILPPTAEEVRPSVPDETPKEKVKGLRSLWAPKEKPSTNGSGERKPTVPKKRHGTADFWGGAISPVASLLVRANPGLAPMGTAMVWSSPVAGDIIEGATKGTIIDTAVQPFCRTTEKWQDLFDLFGLWAAIGVAAQNPAMGQGALMFAHKRMVNLLPRIAAKIKAEQKKEREAVEALADLMPDIGALFPDGKVPQGVDPVMALIESMFAVPVPEPEPAPA